MLYLGIFVFLVIAAVILLFIIKVSIILEYVMDGNDDHTTISVAALGGLLKFKREFSLKGLKTPAKGKGDEKARDKEEEKEKDKDKGLAGLYDKYTHFKAVYGEIKKIGIYLKKKLVLKELSLEVSIGTGDAFYTGIVTGAAWGIAGAVTALIVNSFKTEKYRVNVKPDYMEEKLNVDLFCIFVTKSVYIIVVGLKYFFARLMERLKEKHKLKFMIGGGLFG